MDLTTLFLLVLVLLIILGLLYLYHRRLSSSEEPTGPTWQCHGCGWTTNRLNGEYWFSSRGEIYTALLCTRCARLYEVAQNTERAMPLSQLHE